jgi:single-stranded DNA-binding protein
MRVVFFFGANFFGLQHSIRSSALQKRKSGPQQPTHISSSLKSIFMATVLGNIFREPKICDSDGGKFIAFTVVEQDKYKNKEGKTKYRKSYFNCVMWNATNLAPYLTEGIPVEIRGSMAAKTYTDTGNKTKAGINVLVKSLDFIQYPKEKKDSTNEESFEDTFEETE